MKASDLADPGSQGASKSRSQEMEDVIIDAQAAEWLDQTEEVVRQADEAVAEMFADVTGVLDVEEEGGGAEEERGTAEEETTTAEVFTLPDFARSDDSQDLAAQVGEFLKQGAEGEDSGSRAGRTGDGSGGGGVGVGVGGRTSSEEAAVAVMEAAAGGLEEAGGGSFGAEPAPETKAAAAGQEQEVEDPLRKYHPKMSDILKKMDTDKKEEVQGVDGPASV